MTAWLNRGPATVPDPRRWDLAFDIIWGALILALVVLPWILSSQY
jgi:hypothetical protein